MSNLTWKRDESREVNPDTGNPLQRWDAYESPIRFMILPEGGKYELIVDHMLHGFPEPISKSVIYTSPQMCRRAAESFYDYYLELMGSDDHTKVTAFHAALERLGVRGPKPKPKTTARFVVDTPAWEINLAKVGDHSFEVGYSRTYDGYLMLIDLMPAGGDFGGMWKVRIFDARSPESMDDIVFFSFSESGAEARKLCKKYYNQFLKRK